MANFFLTLANNKVTLSWNFISDEINNNVSLERSTDGVTFNSIFRKNYINNGGTLQTFSDISVDGTPFRGNNYYRIKIIQQNGNHKYSNIEQVYLKSNLVVKVEPNPVQKDGVLKIILSVSTPSSHISIDLFDITGRKVSSKSLSANGINDISVQGMLPGTYLYRVMDDAHIITGKFLIGTY